jgi:phosphoglycolate phosphatase
MIDNITGKDYSVYRAIFIDLDGTITESGEGCMNAVRYMFGKVGYEENDEARIRSFVGPPIKKHLISAFGFSEERAAETYAYYREYYLDKGIHESRLYDGIEEALHMIKASGRALYIATSKPEVMAMPILERYGLLPLFDAVFGARHEEGIYDKTQVLEYGISRIGQAPADAVMVGDRCHDIIGGRAVGFDTIGVLYGYGDRKELLNASPDYIIDSVADLAAMLGVTK